VASFPYQHMGMVKKEHMTIPQVEFWIEWMILQYPIVVFAKSYDKKSKNAIKWLSLYLSEDMFESFIAVVHLDLEGFDHKTMFDIEKRLFYKSNRRILGVPAVFFLGEYIGDDDMLYMWYCKRKLADLLEEVRQKWNNVDKELWYKREQKLKRLEQGMICNDMRANIELGEHLTHILPLLRRHNQEFFKRKI